MTYHQPVLCSEVIEALRIKPGGRYMDCTYGRGGHSRAILGQLGSSGRLLVLDRDPDAIAHALDNFAADDRVSVKHCAFGGVGGVSSFFPFDGVLFDLGVSLDQLRDSGRGFSFSSDEPVDMRMDPGSGVSAAVWLAGVSVRELESVLREYGEERYAGRIARAVVSGRPAAGWRTGALASCIAGAVPYRRSRVHPATRSFQAIRIKVNNELDELRSALASLPALLAACGRVVVISFHSLEDRIVKHFFRAATGLRVIGSLVRAGSSEIAANPRARSARLRVAERCS